MNEDAQPNERRLGRKGGPVPAIRLTHPRGNKSDPRRERHRRTGDDTYHPRQARLHHAQGPNSTNNAHSHRRKTEGATRDTRYDSNILRNEPAHFSFRDGESTSRLGSSKPPHRPLQSYNPRKYHRNRGQSRNDTRRENAVHSIPPEPSHGDIDATFSSRKGTDATLTANHESGDNALSPDLNFPVTAAPKPCGIPISATDLRLDASRHSPETRECNLSEPLRFFSSGSLSVSPLRIVHRSSVRTPHLSRCSSPPRLEVVPHDGNAFSLEETLEPGLAPLRENSATNHHRTSFGATLSVSSGQDSDMPDVIHDLQIPAMQSVEVPMTHDKPRRVLFSKVRRSMVMVSAHGTVSSLNTRPLRHISTVRMSCSSHDMIDDACLIDINEDMLVISAHASPAERVSWSRLRQNRTVCEQTLSRPWNKQKKGGVSAVSAMMHSLQFVTGGYDHVVHLWEIKEDISSAFPRVLALKHNSQINSLLPICDTSHKLISAGADCIVHLWDLTSERVVNTIKTSNTPYQAHSGFSPYCILLEVAHRDLQAEIHDYRLVPVKPVQRFGYAAAKVHGRYIRGDTTTNHFACGGRDGHVRIWDSRNVESPVEVISCGRSDDKIVQTSFNEKHIITCSETGRMNVLAMAGQGL